MKASEILRRYRAGQKNFRGANLRGHSFKGQDLSGADFSEADLRSTNFTEATLIGTNFSNAKCGIQRRWLPVKFLISILLTLVGTFFSNFLRAFFLTRIISPVYLQTFDNSEIHVLITPLVVVIFSISTYLHFAFKGFSSNSKKTIITIFILSFFVGYFISLFYAFSFLKEGGREAAFMFPFLGFAGGISLFMVCIASILLIVCVSISSAVSLAGCFVGIFIVGCIVAAMPMFNTSYATYDVEYTYEFFHSIFILGLSLYVARCALNYDKRFIPIHIVASFIRSIGGTNFQKANLAEANFTRAVLKNSVITGATVTRTRWFKLKGMNLSYLDLIYFRDIMIRKLLIIGEGQNQNFDRKDLRGFNLKGANLNNASFIDTDLSQANLQESNLFEAKLVQTNLDQTNLSNADLTGAYIENWSITRRTRLEGVKCKYVYQKLPTEGDRDPNRMPPSEQGEFGKNDFNIFITSVLDTLDLYHKDNINAGLAITILKGLTEDHPVQFELVGLEKRGDKQFVIRLKVFGQTSHFQLQREYYARYEQTLPLYDPKKLMPDTDNVVAEIIKTVEENPGTHIENLHNQGIVITGGKVDMSGDHIEQSGNFGVGVNKGKINVEKFAGTLNEAEQQNLADAATEIQQLLNQLSQTNSTKTTTEKLAVINEVTEQIESNPTLKAKVINALKAGGVEAFKEAIDHPLVNILIATIEGWKEIETE